MKCYKKEYSTDKKIKTISCDSQYCEYSDYKAGCGYFESFFIPYDYCVVGMGAEYDRIVSWFVNWISIQENVQFLVL